MLQFRSKNLQLSSDILKMDIPSDPLGQNFMCLSPIYVTEPSQPFPPLNDAFLNTTSFIQVLNSKRNSSFDLKDPIIKKVKREPQSLLPSKPNIPHLKELGEDSDKQKRFFENDRELLLQEKEKKRNEINQNFQELKSKSKAKPNKKVSQKLSDQSGAKSGQIFTILTSKTQQGKKESSSPDSLYTINKDNNLEPIFLPKLSLQQPPQSSIKLSSFSFPLDLSKHFPVSIPKFTGSLDDEGEYSLRMNDTSLDNLQKALQSLKRSFSLKQKHQFVKLGNMNMMEEFKYETTKSNSIPSTCESETQAQIPLFRPQLEIKESLNENRNRELKNEVNEKNDEEITVTNTLSMEIEEETQKIIKTGKEFIQISQKKIIKKVEVTKSTRDLARMRTLGSKSKQKIDKGKRKNKKKFNKKFISRWDMTSERRKNRWQLVQSKEEKTIEIGKKEVKFISRTKRSSKRQEETQDTPVGPEYQVCLAGIRLREPIDKQRKPKKIWDPESVPKKRLDFYFRRIEEVLECDLNQQKAIKILTENDSDLKKVWKAIEGKEREYKKEFDINARRRIPRIIEE